MKKFEMHQKDAIMAKMNDLSCTVFASYDNGETWEARGEELCYYSRDSADTFTFDPYALYVTVCTENKEAAIACLIDGKTVEASYCGEIHTITKQNIFDDFSHWLVFSKENSNIKVKKEPLIMWVAATADSCSKPHNSCAELAKKLSLDHDGEIIDGQVVGGFTFNMIKVVL